MSKMTLKTEGDRHVVVTRRFAAPPVETRFEPDGNGTLMTLRMTLPDAATRAAMLATGMEHGMEASYVRLETMI
jgi:hypothetical protein